MSDLLEKYMAEEGSHIKLLLKVLENTPRQSYLEYQSNLFNFYIDFTGKIIVIEDECGLFSGANGERQLELQIELCITRLEKKLARRSRK